MLDKPASGRFLRGMAAGNAVSTEVLSVWTIWALMSLGAFWFVANFGLTIPYADEWVWLPQVVGREPISPGWLWSQHVDHRMVLPRLIYMGLGKLSGFNFQAGTFYNAFLLSMTSLIMIRTARAVRGETKLPDAFFPLLLLHWGQYTNLGWGFQLNFLTSVFIACTILALVARSGEWLSPRTALSISLCLTGLGLCGGFGLAYIPAIAGWVTVSAFVGYRRTETGTASRRALTLVWVALPVAFMGLYFVGFNKTPASAPWPGMYGSIRTALQFLSSCIGPAGKELWPVSGALVVGACLLSAWHGCRVLRDLPSERVRVLGFLCFMAATGVLAAAIGFGRAYEGPSAGFMVRYMSLAMPFACCFFLMCIAYFPPALSQKLQRVMFVVMCVLMVINARKGIRYAKEITAPVKSLEQDAVAGVPPKSLSIRYCQSIGFNQSEARFAACFVALREAHLGPYGNISRNASREFCCVKRLGNMQPSAEAVRNERLTSGESFAQVFQIQHKSKFSRIDVQLLKWRKGRSPDHLDWTLSAIAEDGSTVALRKGRIDLFKLARYDYAKLRFQPVGNIGGERFELALRVPKDESSHRTIEFPLYQTAGSKEPPTTVAKTSTGVRAFIYFVDCTDWQ